MRAADPFDVVLVDLHMPGLDGLATAAAIHADPCLAGASVVLLAPIGQRPADDTLRAHGVAAVVNKPVRVAQLLDAFTGPGNARATPLSPGTRVQLGLRVLVADDNPVNQRVALEMLRRLGCDGATVGNGAEAVAAIERDEYDLVLMDVQMPEMDGFEATALIRAGDVRRGRRLPVIAMTAHAMEGDSERCLAAGMDGYVSKPVKTMDLARALAPYAGRRTADAFIQ
jgi:CheY-like chemotaxis protein